MVAFGIGDHQHMGKTSQYITTSSYPLYSVKPSFRG